MKCFYFIFYHQIVNRKTEYVYMGWAQKQDFVLCTSPSMINELKFKKNTEENPIEDQDPAEDLGMTKSKSNKKKR